MEDPVKYTATGRRKESVARVRLVSGKGNIVVNNREFANYFIRETDRIVVQQPLSVTDTTDKFDCVAKVSGGGISGQTGAMRLGIARALVKFDESLTPVLKKNGFLSRDARMKERKKFGQKGARKRFQWTKR